MAGYFETGDFLIYVSNKDLSPVKHYEITVFLTNESLLISLVHLDSVFLRSQV